MLAKKTAQQSISDNSDKKRRLLIRSVLFGSLGSGRDSAHGGGAAEERAGDLGVTPADSSPPRAAMGM